ncbi:Ff.00g129420.m01.CDS01 [Fusarium sp. VM40]|nr:Ff.00g129420.m01.CDS01 [Fusarium sp. VM40]
MALIRGLIRRRLGHLMAHCTAPKNYELDYLAIRLVNEQYQMLDNNKRQLAIFQYVSSQWEAQAPEYVFAWKVETGEETEPGTYFIPYPRPRESSSPPDTHNTDAQRVVLVRKRLGDLCRWTSSASKQALILTQSIERFLDEFLRNRLPASNNVAEVGTTSVVRHPPQSSTTDCDKMPLPDISEHLEEDERIEWDIPFSCSNTGVKTEVKLLLIRGGSGRWMVDLAGIEAVLSLWMANLNTRNSLQDKYLETADWRRAGIASNVDYCRILGERRGGVLKRDISWWVNDPEIHEEKEIQEGEGPDTVATESAARGHRSNEIKITIGFLELSTGLRPTEPTKASDLLLQYSNADLTTLTAQHLFTSFMWTIGEYIARQVSHQESLDIGEHVKVQPSSNFDLHPNMGRLSGRKLNHVNLTRFVTYAEKQGLGTADEILLCIIPTLSFYDCLPNDAVFGCDQAKIKLAGRSRSKEMTCGR